MEKKTGAWLTRFALEQLGVRHVLGIPGVHTTELYDEFAQSPSIQPVLVTHECSAAFMADAISRTSQNVGTLLVVPGAGLTHAASGIGEAFLDGIPMLVLSGGIRQGGAAYQLHDIDQQALMAPITKARWRVEHHHQVVITLYLAYREAVRGNPGPVYVELPTDLLISKGDVGELPEWPGYTQDDSVPRQEIELASSLLEQARRPGLFVGWGARHARDELVRLAEMLGAPVATTLQGLSSFPADHPLHVGMGYGLAAVPAAQRAFETCDCLLAIGTRFSQVGTGSYSMEVPENLIHIDIDPGVFSKNYPAKIAIAADARHALKALLRKLDLLGIHRDSKKIAGQIAGDKATYLKNWRNHDARQKVNPARLFQAIDALWSRDSIVVADDGNHTFLTAELLPMEGQRRFISPTDFNCMGYAVPAALGAKLANPGREVVAIVGDGAFLMTGNELLTAEGLGLGVVVIVFCDGELAQIAQTQQIPYNRKTCTVLKPLNLKAAAAMTGSLYFRIGTNADIEPILAAARAGAAASKPALIEVNIDYSKKTAFTEGIVKANLRRLPRGDKARIVTRAVMRRLTPQES